MAALVREAHVAAASGDLTELRRGTDTAGQLAALHDAMRGTGEGAEHEMRTVSRVSMTDDTDSVHEASALDIATNYASGETVPGGFLGEGGDVVRLVSSDFESWKSNYMKLCAEYRRQRGYYNWIVAGQFGDAISEINSRLIEAYVEFGGSIDSLKWDVWDDTAAVDSYLTLRRLADEAVGAGDINRASGIEEILASIVRLTTEFFNELDARTDEFDRACIETNRIRALDPRIDAQKVTDC